MRDERTKMLNNISEEDKKHLRERPELGHLKTNKTQKQLIKT